MRILVTVLEWHEAAALAPFVAPVGGRDGASVRFAHIRPIPAPLEGKWGRVVATTDEQMDRLCARAREDSKEAEAVLAGIAVESVMRFGEAREEILIEAAAWGADLIAMSSRRAQWLRHVWDRDVTRRVLRRSPVPVLLYQPPRVRRTDRLGRWLEWAWPSGAHGRPAIGVEVR
jgi:nucleotide-binding universal stress UspA family protein